jgi:hypothetical protein
MSAAATVRRTKTLAGIPRWSEPETEGEYRHNEQKEEVNAGVVDPFEHRKLLRNGVERFGALSDCTTSESPARRGIERFSALSHSNCGDVPRAPLAALTDLSYANQVCAERPV